MKQIVLYSFTLFLLACGQVSTQSNQAKKENPNSNSLIETVKGQRTIGDLNDILNRIRTINEVQDEHIGFAGAESENFKNYLNLKSKANIAELINLTDDTNSVVACYASWALIDKSYNDLPSVFIKFFNNDKYVSTFSGCIKSSDLLSSEFYHRYWNRVSEKANDKTLFTLDSLVLFSDKSYWLLTVRALKNRVYPTTFNKRIEYLAFTKANIDAIAYLKNLNNKTYDEQIKQALVKYLQQTNFSGVGVTPYFETVNDILKYDNDKLKSVVLTKLKTDKFWENDEEHFLKMLKQYGIKYTDIK